MISGRRRNGRRSDVVGTQVNTEVWRNGHWSDHAGIVWSLDYFVCLNVAGSHKRKSREVTTFVF
jgi:hypothetical protein